MKKAAQQVALTVKTIANKARKVTSQANLTYTTGISNSRTIGALNITSTPSVSIDTKGNVALQYSYSVVITTGAGFGGSVGYSSMVTNAPSTSKLTGESGIFGGSAFVPVEGIPIGGGADFCFIPDSQNGNTYFGISQMRGIASPGSDLFEFHLGFGNTIDIFSFNVFDIANVVCDAVLGG